ncbi:hypothetical protein ACHQM5_012503 [Ranunculus cassubicifolius]
MTTMRRAARWYPPPPQTPRILNIPRRIRRKPTKQIIGSSGKGKLESLFDQERVFSRSILNSNGGGECCDPRRERVEDMEFSNNGDFELEEEDEEKWKFQAEILRAECNFLRMERDIALKKLELNRFQTKRTLRSAVETLVSGKEKIHEGKRVSFVLEEEIEELEYKLKDLQRNSTEVNDFEFRKCSNFDKEACVLQKRLQKLGGEQQGLLYEEKCVNEFRELAQSSLTIKTTRTFDPNSPPENRFKDVEKLRRKMERLSKGMLEKMEDEYGSMLSSSTSVSCSASATSSASTSKRTTEFPFSSSSAQVQSLLHHKEKTCNGKCKKIVRKIVEQVRSEMEQWTEMQEMLECVREEMEELHSSRDFWQDRALASEAQFQSLQSSVEDWTQKARNAEAKVAGLEKHIEELYLELRKLKVDQKKETPQDTNKEKEKRVLICRLKENRQRGGNGTNKNKYKNDDEWKKEKSCVGTGKDVPKRTPLKEIQKKNLPGSSPLLWENNVGVHFPMP